MTQPTLCIADVSVLRASAFELGRLRRCKPCAEVTMAPAALFTSANHCCQVGEDRYFTHIGRIAPPNSAQKLTRPGAGPAAEPPSQLTSVAGGMPPASLIARRFAARL